MSLVKTAVYSVVVGCLSISSLAQADVCSEVVSDTVAEMRAGAGANWTEDMEALVRSAAGSSCIKATSARYGQMSSERVTSETVSGAAPAAAAEAAEPAKDDELVIRPLTSSPSKKPYERARSQSD